MKQEDVGSAAADPGEGKSGGTTLGEGSSPRPSRWLRWLGLNRWRQHKKDASAAARSELLDPSLQIFNFGKLQNLKLYDVAVPRADISAIPITSTLPDLLEAFRNSTYTRLPVFDETLDNPVGLVHLKDVALDYGFGCDADAFDLKSLLRPLLYAPPSMRVGVMLQKMQAAHQHMALVIDEYGGVDGLVTMEDLVEQVVGQISDEHDAIEGQHWVEEEPDVYLCQSRASLEDFEAEIGTTLLPDAESEDVDTLGGIVFMLAGRVPVRGEVLRHPDGHEFEVVDADARRIKRLRVRIFNGTRQEETAPPTQPEERLDTAAE